MAVLEGEAPSVRQHTCLLYFGPCNTGLNRG